MHRLLLITLALIGLCRSVSAQLCGGNLGENIFTAGDFGSGVEVIVPDDPGIAPGFVYRTDPPPPDGFYMITNNTGNWSDTYFGWGRFADNSSDPRGYMMVVNAAFEPGLFYEQRIEGLCENTVYQFGADIRNIIEPGGNLIKPDVSFLLDDVAAFTTGPIDETGRWETYGFTFTTAPGQTELTLSLRNNAPGGAGNDLALDNISFRACGPEARIAGAEELRLCEDGEPALLTADIQGNQYDTPAQQWQQSFDEGATWTDLPGENDPTFLHTDLTSGFYYYRYLLANGPANLANDKCRVVSNVKVVYVVPKRYEIVDTLCRGLSFAVGNQSYSQTGTSLDTLISSLGCDSIVTLRLTVVDDPGLVADFTVTDPSCDYTTDGSIVLNGVAGAVLPLDVVVDNQPLPTGQARNALAEGSYAYAITDRYGCATAGTVELSSPNPFAFDLGPPRQLELGEAVRLTYGTSGPIATYDFRPAGVFDCTTDCEDQAFRPERSTVLVLTATSPAGCVFTDSLRLTVLRDRSVYAPSAFSPNGDGINDRFRLFADVPRVDAVREMSIYDRWGNEVFREGEVPINSGGWDGTLQGRPLPGGTYVYRAVVTFLDGEAVELSGPITLIR